MQRRPVSPFTESGNVMIRIGCARDVIFLPPNQGALKGKDSIRGVAEGIKRSFIEPKIVEQEIGVSGDLAFARNLVSKRFTPRDGGESCV